MIFLRLLDVERRYCRTDLGPFWVGCGVAGVCARWRQVALGIPALWSSIEVILGSVDEEAVARQVEYIETFLARASASPIEVGVYGEPADSSLPTLYGAVTKCFSKARIIDMHLTGDRPSSIQSCFFGDAPYLEEFTLQYILADEEDSSCRLQFFSSAPLLQIFSWQGPRLLWALGTRAFAAVTDIGFFTSHLDTRGLNDMLTHMPNVRSLVASTQHLSMDNAPTTLSINCVALKSLTLYDNRHGIEIGVLSRMRFPSLLYAFIEGEMSSDATSILLQHTMPAVESLTIGANVGLALLPGLRSAARLQHLELFSGYDDTAVDLFDELSRPANDGGWACPQLRKLHLPTPPASVRNSILHFARARGPRAPAGVCPPASLCNVSFVNFVSGAGGLEPQFAAELALALSAP